jgi:hypothetical protein
MIWLILSLFYVVCTLITARRYYVRYIDTLIPMWRDRGWRTSGMRLPTEYKYGKLENNDIGEITMFALFWPFTWAYWFLAEIFMLTARMISRRETPGQRAKRLELEKAELMRQAEELGLWNPSKG